LGAFSATDGKVLGVSQKEYDDKTGQIVRFVITKVHTKNRRAHQGDQIRQIIVYILWAVF
jgi:hypothetical protein